MGLKINKKFVLDVHDATGYCTADYYETSDPDVELSGSVCSVYGNSCDECYYLMLNNSRFLNQNPVSMFLYMKQAELKMFPNETDEKQQEYRRIISSKEIQSKLEISKNNILKNLPFEIAHEYFNLKNSIKTIENMIEGDAISNKIEKLCEMRAINYIASVLYQKLKIIHQPDDNEIIWQGNNVCMVYKNNIGKDTKGSCIYFAHSIETIDKIVFKLYLNLYKKSIWEIDRDKLIKDIEETVEYFSKNIVYTT